MEEFGLLHDPEGAVEKARKWAEACLDLGGDWLYYESFLQEVLLCHVKKGHNSMMAKSWAMFEAS